MIKRNFERISYFSFCYIRIIKKACYITDIRDITLGSRVLKCYTQLLHPM